ncbi:hypothetical protein ACFPER_17840 [Agromyces aurantiacus]|uniref:Uncharacterized protein n=1 Tax=Agromyces aurantiacus TaxID=165814 RepID=A0ABV9RBK1_9MICO|nr:hypothetical protein [Agromyces aurantiacus]MBM7505352.1 membrane protein implicated in regulation of membrane protease activity [Agromyces aurantiacus]
MLLALEAGTATVSEIVVPILVTVLTVAGALVAPRLNASADDLKRAEQLTGVLDGMADSPERELVRQVRDDQATAWALRASAPPFPRLRAAGLSAYYAGVVALIAGPVVLVLAPGYQWWFWAWYLAGTVLLVVGALLAHRRSMRRREWMSAERRRRGLRPPVDARLFRAVANEPERRRYIETFDTDWRREAGDAAADAGGSAGDGTS